MTAGDIYLGVCGCCDDDDETNVDDPGRDDGVGDEWAGENAFWWGRYTIRGTRRESKEWDNIFLNPNPPPNFIPGRFPLDMVRKPDLASSGGTTELRDNGDPIPGGPVWTSEDSPTDYLGWQYEGMDLGGCLRGVITGNRLSYSDAWRRGAWVADLKGEVVSNPNPYLVFVEIIATGLVGSTFVTGAVNKGLVLPGMSGHPGSLFFPFQPTISTHQGLAHHGGWRVGETHLQPRLLCGHDYTNLHTWFSSEQPFRSMSRITIRVSYVNWDDWPNPHTLTGIGEHPIS